MSVPDFRVIETPDGDGVTYTCGCPCTPTARPEADGKAGREHCCCGKVHFVGEGAAKHLEAYITVRAATRKREPTYTFGHTTIVLGGRERDVAWAFPVE
jgi:hypothetical protein